MQVEMILLGLVLLTLAVNSTPVDRVKRQFPNLMRNFGEDLGEPCEPSDCPFMMPQRRMMANPRGRAFPPGFARLFRALDLPFAPPASISGVGQLPPVSPPAAATKVPATGAAVAPPAGAAVAPPLSGPAVK